MELKDMFSVDFQKAMKRVARGSQKGSVSEHPIANTNVCTGVVGKGKKKDNFSFYQPRKEKEETAAS